MDGGTPHIAYNACAVRPILHECLSDVEQDLHLVVQHFIAVLRCIFDCFGFHNSPYSFPISAYYITVRRVREMEGCGRRIFFKIKKLPF